MVFAAINYSREGYVGTIQLNRPQRMNAVNEEMYREIRQVLKQARDDAELRVLVITGSVYRKEGREKPAFCAGADLKAHAAGTRNKTEKRQYIELAHLACLELYEFPRPTIAAVNGPARGAGFELALNCDFILMADSASLAFSETGLGTFVGGGVTALLPALIGLMRARELIYTGRIIDGPEAVELGLALKSVPLGELPAETARLAGLLAEKAPLSMKLAKERLRSGGRLDVRQALKDEKEAILSCMESEDWGEGLRAFAEKRKPVYRGR